MNKWQKVACQIARDNLKKPNRMCTWESFRDIKNGWLNDYKKMKYPFERFVHFKNWNKGYKY